MKKKDVATSRNIAGLIGPALVAISISEAWNAHIWATNLAAVVHFNGAVLFVTGLAIVRAHNHWVRGWPVIVTLTGWVLLLLGLLRMFAPERYLAGVQSTSTTILAAQALAVGAVGAYLAFKAYWHDRD
jgi:hypothetical protein